MNTRLYKNAKGSRSASDHRRANPNSGTRRKRIRDGKKFKTVEREHDQLRRFGSSIKVDYIDSDADGIKDLIIRKTRITSVGSTKYQSVTAVPSTGPGSLSSVAVPLVAPVSGPSNLSGIVNTPVPASGPSNLSGSAAAPAAPVSGPTGISANVVQFNVDPISTDQIALIATTPATGTIKYSSDSEALFIFDGTDWQHYKSDG